MRRAAEDAGFDPTDRNNGSREWLVARTGVPARRIYGILYEEGPTTTFDTVDRILIGLDLMALWHLGPEEGGLADYYEATLENPAPPLPEHTPAQRAYADKHNARRLKAKKKRERELGIIRRKWQRKEVAA